MYKMFGSSTGTAGQDMRKSTSSNNSYVQVQWEVLMVNKQDA